MVGVKGQLWEWDSVGLNSLLPTSPGLSSVPQLLVIFLTVSYSHREPVEFLPDQGGDRGEAWHALSGPDGRHPRGHGPPLCLQ